MWLTSVNIQSLVRKHKTWVHEGEIRWDRTLWWYHEGNRAVRDGDWKLVAARDEPWELFNLAHDRNESDDLAEEQPDRVEELEAEWERILAEIREVAPLKDKVHAE
jgi:arylsulfatase A-like enzyme